MRKLAIALFAAVLVLAACVTINVYFPAAEAQEAAREFVDKVIGEAPEGEPQSSLTTDSPVRFSLLGLLISDAQCGLPRDRRGQRPSRMGGPDPRDLRPPVDRQRTQRLVVPGQ